MYIKTSKGEFQVANWMIAAVLIVADNMFANYCKKKTASKMIEKAVKSTENEEEEL